MNHALSIDIETFSSVDLIKCGLFKYAESPDFDILIFAYSVDGGEVEVIDLAGGDILPNWLVDALTDARYVKQAYNAVFEWVCINSFFAKHGFRDLGNKLPISQWRCTMVQGMYHGYPAGLAQIGEALGLASEKKKQTQGKALIRYFSMPCAPTSKNGGRLRNLPHHDIDKWALYKEYCRGDVIAEMEVAGRLSNFPLPLPILMEWQTDVAINSRGVSVDMDLVESAIDIGEKNAAGLMDEAVKISGLENPGSTQQLRIWLEEELGEGIPDLRKDTVIQFLGKELESDDARRMLEIRQEISKTSTKKYNAIKNAVCADGRIRGLLQFYGAGRTGRWAGRLVQVQNLPRTYIEPPELARDLIKGRESDKLRFCYGKVPDTLSQMIRTALVAKDGCHLIDADFAAIEARVLAWLAGETWRLTVFKTHGKIYEASAAAMFNVPLETIGKGSPLRQKGKVAELALGYQGSSGALMSMGALDMGLSEEELPQLVRQWRNANLRITAFWQQLENAAVSVVGNGISVGINNSRTGTVGAEIMLAMETDKNNGLEFLTIRLPSGRKLYYAKPQIGQNAWGRPNVTYMGNDSTSKKWARLDTYGGKLAENVTQAVARDCLSEAVTRLTAAGLGIVFHVHDEIVVESYSRRPEEILDTVTKLMSEPMPWAQDLPLGADGWIGKYYKKD